LEKPFVLIIEDERDIAALFRHVLDLAGYRTEIIAHGKLAMERLLKHQPDIVLLDLTLPGVPGAEILRLMRADERLRTVPVVVITAYAEVAESLAVEPDLLMLKPVSADQLTSLVHRLCQESKTLQAEPFGKKARDPITGLYNRSFFVNRLDSAFKSLKEDGQNLFALFSLSPNLYETINRAFGKREAEAFLHEMADVLRASVRPTDTIARFEQDHFFILVEQAPHNDIPERIAARIQEKLNSHPAGAHGERFTSSLGVLLCDDRYNNVREVLRDSKTAYALASARQPGTCPILDHDSIKKGRPAEPAGLP
jgi:diguanylate cyclase (GGDEF)-like protein